LGLFYFKGKKDPLEVDIRAQGMCPRLRPANCLLEFGECPANEHRQIMTTIENKSEHLTVSLNFKTPTFFSVNPKKLVLPPKAID